jgi:hypothetical protein
MFFSTFFGASGYKGDLQPNTLSLLQAKPVGGIGFNYEITSRIFAKLEFDLARVNGDDKYNVKNRKRNLSFKSDVYEFSLMAEYNLFDLYDYKVTPYFFAGIAVFKFSPYYELPNGIRQYLQDYTTEGQGFYLGRTKYKLTEWSIPFGAGLQWSLSKNIRLALSVGIRKTNTDYLDDVSTNYIDPTLYALNGFTGTKLENALFLNNRETNGQKTAPGGKRGSPVNNDAYFSFNIKLGVNLRQRIR